MRKRVIRILSVFLCCILVLQTVDTAVFAMESEEQINLFEEDEISAEDDFEYTDPEDVEGDMAPGEELFYDDENETGEEKPDNAQALGELNEYRTADTKTFSFSDGTKRVFIYPQAVHFTDEKGELTEYDNTMTEVSENGKKEFVPAKNDTGVRIAARSGENDLVSIEKNGYALSWTYEGINKQNGKVIEAEKDADPTTLESTVGEVYFADAFHETDMQYLLVGDKIKENIILHSSESPTNFPVTYKYTNLVPVLSNDGHTMTLLSPEGEIVYTVSAPFMTDAAGETSSALYFELKEIRETGFSAVLYADTSWLSDTARDYPVVIDPLMSTSQSLGASYSAFVSSKYPSNTYGQGGNHYEGSLYVGNFGSNYNITRSYIKFNLPALTAGDRVVEAKMYTWLAYCYPALTVNLHKVTADWDQSTVCWNNKPSYSAEIHEYKDFITAENESAFSNYEDGHWISWDVTALVDGWYTDPASNHGIALENPAENQSDANGARFYSTGYTSYPSVRPIVYISYRNMSGYEDHYTYESVSAGRGGTADVNVFNGNLVVTQPVTVSNGGLLMPVNISLFFNTNRGYAETGRSGYGWKHNYNLYVRHNPTAQTSSDPNIQKYKYYFEDSDGTRHYFYFASGDTDGVDEDGLGYKLHVDTSVSETAMTSIRYTLTDKNGNTMEFNGKGNVRTIQDNYGHTITVNYQTMSTRGDRISSITDGAGRSYTFTYITDNSSTNDCLYINSITDPASRTTTFHYSYGKLISLVYTDSNTTAFTYNAANRLITITAADGIAANISYDASTLARVAALNNTGGTLTGASYSFTYKKNATAVTDHFGKTYTYQFDTYGHNTGVVCLDSGEAISMKFNDGNSTNAAANKITASSRTQASVKNYAVNPSIAGNLNSYTAAKGVSTDTGNVYYDSTMGHYANGSIKVTKASTDTGYIYAKQEKVGLAAGYYTLSAHVSTDGGTLSAATPVLFVQIKENGAVVATYKPANISTTGAGAWSRRTVTFELAANQTVQLLFGLETSVTGTVWIDDIQLEKGAGMSSFNLLQNPEFYSGTSGWTATGATATTENVDTNLLPGFAKQASFTPASSGTARLSQTFQYKGAANLAFSVGGWIKAASVPLNDKAAASGTSKLPCLQLRIELKNSSGTTLQTANKTFNPYVNDWQFVSFPFKSNQAFTSITVSIVCDYNVNTVKTTGLYCLAEEHGETYAYDSSGNLTAVRNLAGSTDAYGFVGNNLSISASTTGESTVISYDDVNQTPVSAFTTDGGYYSYTNNNEGLNTNATYAAGTVASTVADNAVYCIVNAETGKALGVQSIVSGQAVVNQPLTGVTEQQWVAKKVNDNGEYRFVLQGTTLALHVESAAEDAAIKLSSYSTSSENQKVKLTAYNTAGIFYVHTAVSSYASSVDGRPNRPDTVENNGAVKQKTNNTSYRSQKWYFVQIPSNLSSSLRLESSTAYTNNNNFVSSSTDTNNQTTTYTYNTTNGLLQSVTNPKGDTTSYTYTAMGQIKKVSMPSYDITYAYDDDRLTEINSKGTTYEIDYDDLGRQTTVSAGDVTLSENEYTNNRLTASTVSGRRTEYTYDALDRITQIEYDQLGEKEILYGANGLVSYTVDTGASTHTRYIYDSAERLTSQIEYSTEDLYNSGSITAAVYYGYRGGSNELSSIARRSNGATDTINLTYGALASGTRPGYVYSEKYGTYAYLDYTYDTLGRLSTKTVVGNQTYTYTYKTIGGNRTSAQVQSLATPVGTYTYTYDNNGNITAETFNGNTTSYTYDTWGRMTEEANQAAGKRYVYGYAYGNLQYRKTYAYTDSNHTNCLQTDTFSYTDTDMKDRLTSYNGTAITYGSTGTGMWIGGSSVFFSEAGLVSLDNAHGVSYTYDSSLRRKQKTANGVTTQYYYAGDELMAQTKGGTTIRFKLSAAGDYVGLKYNNTNYYYVKNLQGDVIGIVDANGTLKVSYLYDAWGRVLSVTGTLASTLGADNPIRYRSYYYDTETGWYFLGSRYYNPEWCRFISADTILGANQDIISYNLFAYCSFDPVNYRDPTGYRVEIGAGGVGCSRTSSKKARNRSIQTKKEKLFAFASYQRTEEVVFSYDNILFGIEHGVNYSVQERTAKDAKITLFSETKDNQVSLGIATKTSLGTYCFSSGIRDRYVSITGNYISIEVNNNFDKIGFIVSCEKDFGWFAAGDAYEVYFRPLTGALAAIVVFVGGPAFYNEAVNYFSQNDLLKRVLS